MKTEINTPISRIIKNIKRKTQSNNETERKIFLYMNEWSPRDIMARLAIRHCISYDKKIKQLLIMKNRCALVLRLFFRDTLFNLVFDHENISQYFIVAIL